MNKSQFTSKLSERLGMTEQDSRKVLGAVFSILEETIKSGENVVFVGFGTFHSVVQPRRDVRNPRTGAPVVMPERNNVRFKTGVNFLRYLNPDLEIK